MVRCHLFLEVDMVWVILLLKVDQTRSDDLQPGVYPAFPASPKLLSVRFMPACTFLSTASLAAQHCGLRCCKSQKEVGMAVTKAGSRKRVQAYIRIQGLGLNRSSLELPTITIFEECGKITKWSYPSYCFLFFSFLWYEEVYYMNMKEHGSGRGTSER